MVTLSKRKLFIVALGSGALAAILSFHHIENTKRKFLKKLNPTKAVVPARDLKAGEILKQEDLKTALFPSSFLHPSALKPEEISLVVGQRLRNPVFKGVPLVWTDIGDARRGRGKLSETLVEGERAVSIPVNAVAGVSGFISPGDRVDLLWVYSGPLPGGRAGTVVKLLLQNVNVLAVGTRRGAAAYSTVTLSLTPEEAEIVIFAVEVGKVVLSLRNSRDVSVAEAVPTVSMKDVLGERMERVQKERTLRVIKGRQLR